MKKLLLVISMFVAMSVNAQDDMYATRTKSKKEKIEVSVFNENGQKINFGERYSGVALVTVIKNGKRYVEKCTFNGEEKLTKSYMERMAEEIYLRKRTEEFHSYLENELLANKGSKSDTLIYVDGSTLLLITKDSNGEIIIPTSVADQCDIRRDYNEEITGYFLRFKKKESDLRATYKDVYETKDGGKTYEHKRVIDKVDRIEWNSYDILYISSYSIEKIKKWNTKEYEYLYEVEDAKDKFNFNYEELKSKKILFNCTEKTKKKLETTVKGDLRI